MSTITLLSDFGTGDGYVAAMKGVLLSLAPDAVLVDAAHEVPAQDVRSAGWVLEQYWRCFPAGTIHLAVVDPGVGTARRALLVEAEGHWFLGPDNGLFSWLLDSAPAAAVRVLRPGVHGPHGISATFQGRDVFAWAAGLLAAGAAGAGELSDPAPDPIRAPWTRARREASGRVAGEIVHLDRFGNAITNLRREDLPAAAGPALLIEARGHYFRQVRRTYADVEAGHKLALVGSHGRLELAVREGSAAERLQLRTGDPVTASDAAGAPSGAA
jgi:S-adenosyl-L-methionine hydrolase (adenosine-forming)